MEAEPRKKKGNNFALLTPEQRSEMSRRGGIAVQQQGTGYRWDSKTAKKAIKSRQQKERDARQLEREAQGKRKRGRPKKTP